MPDIPHPTRDLARLWKTLGERYLEESERYTPAIEVLQITTPITLDGETLLIVGIDGGQENLVGYLKSAQTYNHIRRLLFQLTGKPLEFRVIVGETIEDWESIKAAELRTRERQVRPGPGPGSAPPLSTTRARMLERSWDEVMEEYIRRWTATENRSFPLTRARFMRASRKRISSAVSIGSSSGWLA
jgi:hypothetical protein